MYLTNHLYLIACANTYSIVVLKIHLPLIANNFSTMNKKFILPMALVILLTACNNAGDADKKDKDTNATTGHDMNHMPAPGSPVPDLPPVPEGAKVSFKDLKDGSTVTSPLKVFMVAEGIKVDTAGPVIAGVGHHHILIDAGDSVLTGQTVPTDSSHLHFGRAQTQTELKLKPGTHRITLQFADGLHRSYGSRMARSITVTVKE
jgi:hypothetical protein